MITRIKLSTMKQDLPKYRSMLAGNPSYVPPSFESIASTNGTGSSGTITFSSIPGTYKHLQIRYISRDVSGTGVFGDLRIRVNGDTGANYTRHVLQGDGSAATSYSATAQTYTEFFSISARGGQSANMFGVGIIDIHDYASTTRNKTLRCFLGVDNNGEGFIQLGSGLWQSTSAVTSISLILATSSFSTSSQFALYGIKG